jgi:hypothetical protein
MSSPPPLLLTTDERLARIESLLVALETRVDHIERLSLSSFHASKHSGFL